MVIREPFAEYYVKSSEDMSELRDGEVDLILTTPPEWAVLRNELQIENIPNVEYLMRIAIPPKIITECYRVLKEGGFFIYNVGHCLLTDSDDPLNMEETDTRFKMFVKTFYPSISARTIYSIAPFTVVSDVIGLYEGGAAKMEKDPVEIRRQFANRREHWIVFSKGPWELKYPFADVIEHPTTDHYTDFNTSRALIHLFSEEGDLVLDPFAGTGTIGQAAVQMGRDAVMYDKDPDYRSIVKGKIPDVEIHI